MKVGPPPECPCKDPKCPKKPKTEEKKEEAEAEDLGPCAMKCKEQVQNWYDNDDCLFRCSFHATPSSLSQLTIRSSRVVPKCCAASWYVTCAGRRMNVTSDPRPNRKNATSATPAVSEDPCPSRCHWWNGFEEEEEEEEETAVGRASKQNDLKKTIWSSSSLLGFYILFFFFLARRLALTTIATTASWFVIHAAASPLIATNARATKNSSGTT